MSEFDKHERNCPACTFSDLADLCSIGQALWAKERQPCPSAETETHSDASAGLKHSPLPWHSRPLGGLRGTEGYPNVDLALITSDGLVAGIVYEAGPEGSTIDDKRLQGNAELIIVAVNVYPHLKQLVEALKPFAAAASVWESFDGQHDYLDSDSANNITVGNLRRARAALAPFSPAVEFPPEHEQLNSKR